MKNRLRELRAAREWSQSDLADRLRVSRQTVNAIETQRYSPSLPLAFKIARLFAACLCLLLLCSCASQRGAQPVLPREVAINPGAGRGDWMRLKLRTDDGKELLFMLDTGRPHTVLDTSLEPMLGHRLGTRCCWEPFEGGLTKTGLYHSPDLYLGDTKLLTSSTVYTHDLQRVAPGLMGILGMDCLKHYCVQMDFARNQLRFLDPNVTDANDLGQPFPLKILFGLLISRADYFGTGNVWFCPDTGCVGADAVLRPGLLRRALRRQTPVMASHTTAANGRKAKVAGFASGIFGGQTYSNLTFVQWPGAGPAGDLLGLQFLARNLVTFNFPKRTMYLKQQSADPLASATSVFMDARRYLSGLKETNGLPGWPKEDKRPGWIHPSGNALCPTFPAWLTMSLQKEGDPSNYNYILAEENRNAGWQLRRAWRADASGKILTEFRIP